MRFKTYDHRAKRAGGRPEMDALIHGVKRVHALRLPRNGHRMTESGAPVIWNGRLISLMNWVRLVSGRRHPAKWRPVKFGRRRPSVQPFDFRVGITSDDFPF